MAESAPGFWTAWLWKLGLWGLVILFAFLYLGSVEKNRRDTEANTVASTESPASAVAGVGDRETEVDVLVVESQAQAEEQRASVESVASGGADGPASAHQGARPEGVSQAEGRQNLPVSDAVSQVEARAFANAVMSEAAAESTEVGFAADAAGNSSAHSIADASPLSAPVAQPLAPSSTAEVTGSSADQAIKEMPANRPDAPAIVSVSSDAPPTAALSPELPSDVSASGADVPRATVRETAAQRRARIMEEYRAMQRAAQDEMHKRWSGMGGAYPYGVYPQWGHPQWARPQGNAPAGQ